MTEWSDVQALISMGLVNRSQSAHLLLSIKDVDAFKKWLAKDLVGPRRRLATTPDVTGNYDPDSKGKPLYQIAFTPEGLTKMGAPEALLKQFPDPFLEGMAPALNEEQAEALRLYNLAKPDERGPRPTTRRAGILGDVCANHEHHWDWGGATGDGIRGAKIDVLLMLFTYKERSLHFWANAVLRPEWGLELACGGTDPHDSRAAIFNRLERRASDPERPHKKSKHPIEHFGYLDGVSQPMIKGLPRAEYAKEVRPETYRLHAVEPGEFVLGEKNERQIKTPYPELADFGKNGSFYVVRQMAQHVGAYNQMVKGLAAEMGDASDKSVLEDAAGKIMGRRRDGEPLTDMPRENKSLSSFSFAGRDSGGLQCPVSSHIRRANPRDSREDEPETSLRLSKRHRILRRGRIYGANADNDNFDAKDQDKQGVLFMCVNADIAQQFEFIQQTWLNNPTFAGVDGEVDPIVSGLELSEKRFTAPARPQPAIVKRDKPLTTVKGGGYFFLPGKNALLWLAKQPAPAAPSDPTIKEK